MNLKTLGLAVFLLTPTALSAPLEYYLPQGGRFDPAVPKPSAVLGETVGKHHVRHDQLVDYMHRLAEASNRVTIEETGRTHENRPITLVTITSPGNQARIEDIREAHAALVRGEAPPADLPAVIWLGYSIHGNESSGANASMLTAYYLAAGNNPEVTDVLDSCVVLLDPSLNPDGLDRFAQWSNANLGANPVSDPQSREHHEAWPGGRTNHYWFDLNRDWLLLVHPESRARIQTFHRWEPDIFCDFHEMGTDDTFFFQPGVPSRTNPLTPQANQDLTGRIAAYHAKALDQAGRLYFSGEQYDDFYYGKGSTYPDVNGGVGILFEQASSRGQRQDSINGMVEFPFTIKNQFITSLSSLKACRELRADLLQYKLDFYRESRSLGARAGDAGLVFGEASDPVRTDAMAAVLAAHNIQVWSLGQDLTAGGVAYKRGLAYVVPRNQDQFRLIQALFETRTSFPDSLFYDVSTWNLPLSMNVPYAEVAHAGGLKGEAYAPPHPAAADPLPEAHAYALPWEGYLAPRAAQDLLEAGLMVRAATRPMTFPDGLTLHPGALLIPSQNQHLSPPAVADLVAQVARENRLPVYSLSTGLTPVGPDLGSEDTPPLREVFPAIVVGDGVSSYQAGEAWHLLDKRMGMEVTLLPLDRISRRNLTRYTHVIFPGGSYGSLNEGQVQAIKTWVTDGGILMALGRAVEWVGKQELTPVTFLDDDMDSAAVPEKIPYARADADRGSRYTSGTILLTRLDTTHPLGFGYLRDTLPVFRTHNRVLARSRDPYATVAYFTEAPLASGYITPHNLERTAGSASVIAQRVGQGAVLLYNDDPNFRGVWYGTNKLFLNGLFFGPLIQRTGN